MYKKSSQGFTILEIVAVLVIIGLLGITTIPSIAMIRKHEVKKVAKEITLDLSTQRMRAMATATSGAGYAVELLDDLSIGHYHTYRITPANITASSTRGKNKEGSKNVHIVMRTSGGALGLDPMPQEIQFDPRGDMMDSTNKHIPELLIDIVYEDQKAEIVFNGITGHYTIKQ